MIKGELYNDLHPKTSLKNTGYKNKKTALKTISLIRKRSLKYQFDVINTMYNRAKYHQHQTKDMLEAMKIYKLWLQKYSLRNNDAEKYKFITYNEIKKYIKFINKKNKYYNFLKKIIALKNKYYKLQYILLDKNRSDYYDYWSWRIIQIKKLKKKYKTLNNNNKSTILDTIKNVNYAGSVEELNQKRSLIIRIRK